MNRKYYRCDNCKVKHELDSLTPFKIEGETIELLCDGCYVDLDKQGYDNIYYITDWVGYSNEEIIKMRSR